MPKRLFFADTLRTAAIVQVPQYYFMPDFAAYFAVQTALVMVVAGLFDVAQC